MDVSTAISAVAAQQLGAQSKVALATLKQNAQAEQAIAGVLAQATGGRGQIVDVTV